ncbi:AtpZ/AtpI family protein [Patescibacteria group bacterium]|nr:AtpZ/AtpI family protein [Patescibacteria group bacterium]
MKSDNKNFNAKQLALSFVAYSTASIFGPLLIIGGLGYFLDQYFDTIPIITIIAVFIAFIVTNILLFKKMKVVNKLIDQYKAQSIEEATRQKEENKDKQS